MKTTAKKRIIRKIQRWLHKHEYESGYKIKLHKTNTTIDNNQVALCRTGLVLAYGHGAWIEPWTKYTTKQLTTLLKHAKKAHTQG